MPRKRLVNFNLELENLESITGAVQSNPASQAVASIGRKWLIG